MVIRSVYFKKNDYVYGLILSKKRMKYFFLFLFSLSFLGTSMAQTSGELAIKVTTSTAGGKYSPRNIVAIWVEDVNGNFVKTLLAYANKRKTHLNNWEASTNAASSAFNTVDAITGATQSNHATRSCSWNGKNHNGELMPDGTYKLRVELTDKNSTGNYSAFSFTKGVSIEELKPADVPSFSNIQIKWTPLNTASEEIIANKSAWIYTNFAQHSVVLRQDSSDPIQVKIFNQQGVLIQQVQLNGQAEVDISSWANGLYIFQVGKQSHKVMIQ